MEARKEASRRSTDEVLLLTSTTLMMGLGRKIDLRILYEHELNRSKQLMPTNSHNDTMSTAILPTAHASALMFNTVMSITFLSQLNELWG